MNKPINLILGLCFWSIVLIASANIGLSNVFANIPEKNVFVIAYIDADNTEQIFDWFGDHYQQIGYSKEDIEVRTNLLIDYIRCGSTWHGNKYYDCQENSLLNYEVYDIVYSEEIPPYGEDGNFDYAAVYKTFGLCDLIGKNAIDEIWIWEKQTYIQYGKSSF